MAEMPDPSVLRRQQSHWETTFAERAAMFGTTPSRPARYAANLAGQARSRKILELGAGQGRDTLYFARRGFEVTALDYSTTALATLNAEARWSGISTAVTTVCHDVKQPLPFTSEAFDVCYSHMLYCMALTTDELEFLSQDIRRVLRPGGLNIYSARNTSDADYGKGTARGEDMYESNGFIVHFFSREKVVRLATGYEFLALEEFEEGSLPRKLFLVTLRKNSEAGFET